MAGVRAAVRVGVAFLEVFSGSAAYDIASLADMSLSSPLAFTSRPCSDKNFTVSAAAEALPAKSLVLTGGGIGIPPSGSTCIAMWV